MCDPKEALTPLGQMTPKSTCLPGSHPGLQTALGISAWTSKYNPSLGEGQTLGVFLAGKGDLLPRAISLNQGWGGYTWGQGPSLAWSLRNICFSQNTASPALPVLA